MKANIIRSFLVVASCVVLAACSKGPSESDARDAVSQQLAPLMGGAQNDALTKVMDTFTLGECKEANGLPGYGCHYSVTVNGAPLNDEGRFVKTDNGWQVIK